ncbi:SPW repeat protein [Candidatus Daviesbacteria bacterium]|nr:SPW repeat protein [Candidatus Daviesbacteria bacterium]
MYLLTGFLGLVSIIAPYLFNYSQSSAALWTSLAVGAVLIVASIFEGIAADKERWEYWVVGIVGLGAIFAPFVLGFSTLSTALWTLVIIGIVTILAAWTKLFPGQTQWR